jgi:two-component system sensor histidine kinase KdpD
MTDIAYVHASRSPTRPPDRRHPGPLEAAERDVLLGVLAHELRTPITTIYAGTAILAQDDDLLPSMQRELAVDIHAEAARLFRTVEDVLVLSRLEHDALVISTEPVVLSRVADDAARSEGPRWPLLLPMLETGGTPAPVVADAAYLGHALRNLIASVGRRAIRPTELPIVIGSVEGRVSCRLLDRTGSLVAQDLPTLFDLPTVDPRLGLASPGIALFVAATLIRAMRGAVWARPLPERVVELGLSLPLYEAA